MLERMFQRFHVLTVIFQDRIPERAPQTDPLGETNVQDNICDTPIITSPAISAKARVSDSDVIANQQGRASSPAEQVPGDRTSRPQCSTILHESPISGRGNFGEHTGDLLQTVERDDNQSHNMTRATEDASAQQPHSLSRFEPALSGDVHNKPSRMDGAESLGFGVIDVADIGLKLPKVSETSGNAECPRPLTDAANAANPALIELASRTLEARNLAAAASPENLKSIARQVWDSWQVTEPERVQTSPEDAPQAPGSSTSPLTELSLTSTEDSANARSSSSSQGATVRPRGPSALRPLNFGQLQRDSRKTLHDFEGEFFKVARKSCGFPASTTDRKTDESSHQWLPANRSAGGRDWTRPSSVRETQGPLPEPACLNCRRKKKRCDRQRPRCEWLSDACRNFALR